MNHPTDHIARERGLAAAQKQAPQFAQFATKICREREDVISKPVSPFTVTKTLPPQPK